MARDGYPKVGRPKEIDGELENIAVTVTKDLARRIRRQATIEERSNSAIVRRILADYFNRLDAQQVEPFPTENGTHK